MSATPPLLLADIGGTHARFALLPAGAAAPEPATISRLDDFPDLGAAAEAWMATQRTARPEAALLAVAGPVANDNRAVLTNRGWVVEGPALAKRLGLRGVRVVNDFAALARALPLLGPAELLLLGGPAEGAAGAPMSVLGPGTGLGVGAFIPPGVVLTTEGGHATLAAAEAEEAAVVAALRRRLGGHVSAERGALSGQGIEALHAALGGDPERRAPEILAAGVAGADAACRAAMSMFCAMLGSFAGDVALMHGARGGVFIAGGIPPRMPGFLAASAFRNRFEAKGRFREWLAPVPTWLVRDPTAAAMRGLAALASDRPDWACEGHASPAPPGGGPALGGRGRPDAGPVRQP